MAYQRTFRLFESTDRAGFSEQPASSETTAAARTQDDARTFTPKVLPVRAVFYQR